MTGKTHLAAGFIVGEAMAISQGNTELSTVAFILLASAAGSLLPDIDHPQSMIANTSRSTKMVSSSLSAVTQHRGFTHTIVFVGLITALAGYLMNRFAPGYMITVKALCVGMLSHLLLDTLNEKGVMWLWPLWRKHIYIATVRTGTASEKVLKFFLNVVATLLLAYLVYYTALQPYLERWFPR